MVGINDDNQAFGFRSKVGPMDNFRQNFDDMGISVAGAIGNPLVAFGTLISRPPGFAAPPHPPVTRSGWRCALLEFCWNATKNATIPNIAQRSVANQFRQIRIIGQRFEFGCSIRFFSRNDYVLWMILKQVDQIRRMSCRDNLNWFPFKAVLFWKTQAV